MAEYVQCATPQAKEANVKCDKKRQSTMVWADGHSFREVARIQAQPVGSAEIRSVPLTEKMFTEARIAAVLLGPLLIDLPQG
ncbi:hypothetical protein [Stutzerimonas kunmingensis]|uniref:hypothetical protein n=1 Tax=Stutzerimonas kunmingensis TaxID=1211807 RepID=UPI00241DCC14|nr:hypothetical protein [Stutzerimonas kunmingensis]